MKRHELVFDWITHSGICYAGPQKNMVAFYESYNALKRKYSFLYCEITGGIQYLDAAKKTLDWSRKMQKKNGAFQAFRDADLI